MEALRNTVLFVVFIGSTLACTGCKFGWWCMERKYHSFEVPVMKPKKHVYIEEVQPMVPILPPVKQPQRIMPWQPGPTLEPTPVPPNSTEPSRPSSLSLEPSDDELLI